MPNDDNVYLHLTFSSCVKCDFCPSGVTVLLCYYAVRESHSQQSQSGWMGQEDIKC